MFGELIPIGGGDPIPLLKKDLLVGRRESCDICLRFANVSAHHCRLTCRGGYWYVTDQNSRNGTKVNGKRVTEKRIDPGDTVAIAKHSYELVYSPADLGAVGPPPPEEKENLADEIMGRSLLDRAGLERRQQDNAAGRKRYDLSKDQGGRFKDPNEPI
jgi:adenylate cyclase